MIMKVYNGITVACAQGAAQRDPFSICSLLSDGFTKNILRTLPRTVIVRAGCKVIQKYQGNIIL